MNSHTHREMISYSNFMMLLIAITVITQSPPVRAADEPALGDAFRFTAGPYLTLDPLLFDIRANLKRTIHQPERLPQPVVTGKEDQNFQPYISVVRDPATKRFRMWYNTPESFSQSHLGHITSADGLEWTMLKPGVLLQYNHDITAIQWDPIRKH